MIYFLCTGNYLIIIEWSALCSRKYVKYPVASFTFEFSQFLQFYLQRLYRSKTFH